MTEDRAGYDWRTRFLIALIAADVGVLGLSEWGGQSLLIGLVFYLRLPQVSAHYRIGGCYLRSVGSCT